MQRFKLFDISTVSITDNHSTALKDLEYRNKKKNEEFRNVLNLLYRMIHFVKKKVYIVRNEAQVSRIFTTLK